MTYIFLLRRQVPAKYERDFNTQVTYINAQCIYLPKLSSPEMHYRVSSSPIFFICLILTLNLITKCRGWQLLPLSQFEA